LAVYYNEGKFGGVNNSEIPNYIYHWTEREIEKTINTCAPYAEHDFVYNYGSDEPFNASVEKKASLKKLMISTAKPIYRLFTKVFRASRIFLLSSSRNPVLRKEIILRLPYLKDKYTLIQVGQGRYIVK
jgi:hypothetical protein